MEHVLGAVGMEREERIPRAPCCSSEGNTPGCWQWACLEGLHSEQSAACLFLDLSRWAWLTPGLASKASQEVHVEIVGQHKNHLRWCLVPLGFRASETRNVSHLVTNVAIARAPWPAFSGHFISRVFHRAPAHRMLLRKRECIYMYTWNHKKPNSSKFPSFRSSWCNANGNYQREHMSAGYMCVSVYCVWLWLMSINYLQITRCCL